MLSLDNLANRYGLLPSEALARASTFDLRVLEVSSMWITRKQREATEPGLVAAEDLTRTLGQEELKARMQATKRKK